MEVFGFKVMIRIAVFDVLSSIQKSTVYANFQVI